MAKSGLKSLQSSMGMTNDSIDILVRGILIQNGKVLLLKRTAEKGGGYNLVGGHVEKGESPAKGLVREIEEEIGVKVESSEVELIRVVYRNKETSSPKLHLVFWVSNWAGQPQNMEPRKCLGCNGLPWINCPSNWQRSLASF